MSTKNVLATLLLVAIHAFLFAFILVRHDNLEWFVLTLLTVGFLVIGYVRLPVSEVKLDPRSILSLILVPGGALLTNFLYIELKMSVVVAASLVGFLASFVPMVIKTDFGKTIPAQIYCGAFVGMTSVIFAKDTLFIGLAGIIAGVIYLATITVFNGVGGKLGTIAFGGVAMTAYIYVLVR